MAKMRNKTAYKKPPFELDRTRHGDLARQIADGLRTAIETGYYRPGDVLPPVRDLGEILGVSMGIAVQAVTMIREESLISPRPRVGSVVCSKDRPLWKGHIVIVVPPGQGNPFDNMVHAAVRDALTEAGYLVTPATVARVGQGNSFDFALLETVLRQQTDLVVQLHDKEPIAKWLSKCGVPFVRFAEDCVSPPGCVGVVRRDFARALPDFAAHCREAGVRSVLQVADALSADATDILRRNGISVSTLRTPAALRNGKGFFFATWAAETFAKRLAKGRGWLPDLLFFLNDHLANGALLALGAAGVSIPDDVRVVTWANRDYGPAYFKPLTRMEMDNAAVGATLADCILKYFKTGKFPSDPVIGPTYVRGETL